MRPILLAVILLFSIAGCETSPYRHAKGIELNLYQKSNADATDLIIRALKEEGYEIFQTAPDQFLLNHDQHQYVMEPRLIEGGLSRIVVSRLVKIKPEYRNSQKLLAMIITLNRSLNLGKFSMLPENKGGQIQASITFIHETINTEEIRLFLIWMEQSLDQVKEMVTPETLHMLEKPNNN